ncbi:MAG: dipeptide epimerase [Candidatus Glassbacteria bacterium]|nr:dipeptide epimerase [Candidatus Glassbacteria bacterium]
MKLGYETLDLYPRHTFTISRQEETGEVFRNVLVRLEHDGLTGWGEAAPDIYYGENWLTVGAALETFRPLLEREKDPWGAENLMMELDRCLSGNWSAKAAVDMALYDLQGKLCGRPVYEMLGLDPDAAPLSSFTIGIDRLEVVAEKLREAAACPMLKIKLGGPEDLEIMEAVHRANPEAVVRVDANTGWTPHLALEMTEKLVDYNVEFVEQPLPEGDRDGMRWLKARSWLPLIADESCRRLEDVPRAAGLFDGINIKLAKSGGIRHALKMIHTARALGMKVMLGCMIESSIGITAAAQISPLVDYADLDGAALLADDPFRGMEFASGRLSLPSSPGLGVEPRAG